MEVYDFLYNTSTDKPTAITLLVPITQLLIIAHALILQTVTVAL